MHTAKLIFLHLTLYTVVVVYLFFGAYVYYTIEQEAVESSDNSLIEEKENNDSTQFEPAKLLPADSFDENLTEMVDRLSIKHQIDRDQLLQIIKEYIDNLRSDGLKRLIFRKKREEMDSDYVHEEPEESNEKQKWGFSSSCLFAFTILTTIGYGNIAPSTFIGRLFTIFYALLGIPLFLIALTDLGSFVKTAFLLIVQRLKISCRRRGNSKFSDMEKHMSEEKQKKSQVRTTIAEFISIILVFIFFIVLGAAVLPWWEKDLSLFDAVYYTFISISTIGLGDIVPQDMKFLPLTLLYITIGLWLTTTVIEKIADIFKLVHFSGRRITGVENVNIWLGAKRMTMGDVICAVGRKTGVSEEAMEMINWDKTMNNAADGIMPDPPAKKSPVKKRKKNTAARRVTVSMPVLPQSLRQLRRIGKVDLTSIDADADEFAISDPESETLHEVLVFI